MSTELSIKCYLASAPANIQISFIDASPTNEDNIAILFDYDDIDQIGLNGHLICSIDALNQNLCNKTQLGSLLSGKTGTAFISDTEIPIKKSGYWCVGHDAAISPTVSFLNQSIQLPAIYLPLLTFSFYMALMYISLCIYVSFSHLRQLKSIQRIHYCIMAVVWLNMLKTSCSYFYFYQWGLYGKPFIVIKSLVVMLHSLSNTSILMTLISSVKVLERSNLYLCFYFIFSIIYNQKFIYSQTDYQTILAAISMAFIFAGLLNHILKHSVVQLSRVLSVIGLGYASVALLTIASSSFKNAKHLRVMYWVCSLEILPELLIFGLSIGLVTLYKVNKSQKGYEMVQQLLNAEQGKND